MMVLKNYEGQAIIPLMINLNHFRMSLIGDGFTEEEAYTLSDDKLGEILEAKVNRKIEHNYILGVERGLYKYE